MLNNITIDTTNIVANKNIHENIFKARKSNNILNNNKENNSVPYLLHHQNMMIIYHDRN